MLVSDAILKIRAGTLHDTDDQVSAAQYLALVSDEYRRLRRWLCIHAPALCEATVSAITVAATSITKSTSLPNFERVVMVSRLEGGTYYPISTTSRVNTIKSSSASEAGTYEVTYLVGAAASITTATALDLPAGVEDVMIERCCAWVRQRHNDPSWTYHDKRADGMMAEAQRLLKGRGGHHGESGLRRDIPSGYVWFETPTTLEIRRRNG